MDACLRLFTQTGTLGNHLDEFAGHGDFALGLLREGDTDGIANTLGQQGADAYSTLDASVFAFASLCHAKMQRIMHVFLVHGGHKQTNRFHHDHRVGGLDTDDDIVELLSLEDAEELHATFNDTFRGVAIARHDAVAQRTVVHTDTDGRMMFLADLDEGKKFFLDLLQFFGIFRIGIFQMLERPSGVDVIAGIDAHLLTIEGSDIRCVGREMDIGHQWLRIAVGLELGGDMLHILGLTGALGRETYQFTTGIDDTFGLCHTGDGVVGIGGGHRLDADRIVASNANVAHTGFGGLSSLITHIGINWS